VGTKNVWLRALKQARLPRLAELRKLLNELSGGFLSEQSEIEEGVQITRQTNETILARLS